MNTATVRSSTDWSSAYTYVGVLGPPRYQDMELHETPRSASGRNRVMLLNTAVTMSLPTHEFIQDIDVPGWRLLQPLLVKLERSEDGTFVVSDHHSVVYGIGDTPNEARADYIISLIEYYELVSARAGLADEPNSQLLRRLQRFLLPTTS